jgi:hypothetical protein
MNMIFDIWIKHGGKMNQNVEEKLLLKTIWEYAYGRVALLIDEIEAEERNDKSPKAIIIYLMKRPYAIQPNGYSDKFHDKIVECFNDRDAEIMWASVANKLSAFMN